MFNRCEVLLFLVEHDSQKQESSIIADHLITAGHVVDRSAAFKVAYTPKPMRVEVCRSDCDRFREALPV